MMDDLGAVPERITKNIGCVKTLTFSAKSDQGRVLDLKIRDREFRAKLSEFLCANGLEDPLSWTSRIVTEEERWVLSFDKWQFDDGAGSHARTGGADGDIAPGADARPVA